MRVNTFGKVMVAGVAVAAVAVWGSPASADPAPATDYRTLAGAGSDTTQDVMNGLAETIRVNGNKVIASWDARGTAQIKTKATNCQFTRPNGSGAGRQALRAAKGEDLGGTHGGPGKYLGSDVVGCVDFARSSAYSSTTPGTSGNLTYIPFGVDAVALAINSNSDLPRNNSFARVQRVYKCFDKNISGLPVQPLIPQAGSGTRQFWLQQMEITEQEISLGDLPCLTVAGVPNPQEHDGTVLQGHNDWVVPFAAGQFLAQGNNATIQTATGLVVEDRRGPALLTGMNLPGQAVQQPIASGVLNANFPLNRDVYNVVPTADLTNPLINQVFVGDNALACTQTVTVGSSQRNVVQLFGFGQRSASPDLFHQKCGATALKSNS
ncbi:substrate-binding domain-containing protein [Micromonospora narathiwatensis]|uniref:ABC-type phosphate transport system, substrate-binding protein n=1 Tax=Micromonospora narathiwatensis TaxID=299146 RepID=A0A1A9ABM8_9ACTN|nr:substrate-binding domain-containing protein [Micromonospora narathiwatensis]SBT53901.1 ABC-type phosphate transport system, substrate-binding protein [Micromonospora narathiwatensis]